MNLLYRALSIAAIVAVGCQGTVEVATNKAEEAYRAIEKIELPEIAQQNIQRIDRRALQQKLAKAWKEREPQVVEFIKKFPNDLRTAPLVNEYWQSLMSPDLSDEQCNRLIQKISDQTANVTNKTVLQHAEFWKAMLACYRDKENADRIVANANAFSAKYPQDPRGALMYAFVAADTAASASALREAYQTLLDVYPGTQEAERAKAILPLVENLEKPFDLSFRDAATGRRVSTRSLRGKVVVVDFWATWCPPCVAAIPHLKQVYAQYKRSQVEVIGVSMDRPEPGGGNKEFNAFLKEHGVAWPQYFTAGDPSVAKQFGVTLLPTVFILDKKGTVRSIDGARAMEQTIDALLQEPA